MKQISAQEFKEILEREKDNPNVDFIDVRSFNEYNELHIDGVRNVPLDEIESHSEEFVEKVTVYVQCRSGGRSRTAIDILEKLRINAELVNVDGGLLAWDAAGFPLVSA